jgi:peptidoglycan hydrolase-like protein with peptidoglycan-binding domain
LFVSIFFAPIFVSASVDINLKYGHKNEDVSVLQNFLIDIGFLKSEATGYFGKLTLKAVKDYQLSKNLPVTGYVGSMTRDKINSQLGSFYSTGSSNQSGSFPNSKYYPSNLPYISKTALSLPIILPNTTLNPTSYQTLLGSGFKNEYLSITNRLYMVQYKSELNTEQYKNLKPIKNFANNVYIILASENELNTLMSNDQVNFIDNYHPHFKIDPDLVDAFYKLMITSTTTLKVVFSQASPSEEINQSISNVPASIVSTNYPEKFVIINGIVDRQQLFTLANNPLIIEIDLVK